MTLADFIEANRKRVIESWKERAVPRFGLQHDESQLIDDLPNFVDDLVATLRSPPEDWSALESAEHHGRQRVELGVDIGGLTEEMMMMGEVIVDLAAREGLELSSDDIQKLMRVVARATALSAQAYAGMRDKQLASEASRHFSFVAHEIRNPLNSARLVTEILAISPDEERQGHLERLQRALTRLSEQVDNSLVEARLYGEPELELQSTESVELVDAACDDVADHAAERSLELTREVDPFDLDVDPKLITSALTNLLSNAIKFSCRGGAVRIQARTYEDRALFEVEDQCGGLPDDMSQWLFQPYIQKNRDKTGFGLGLTIIKQAVEAHQGTVRVFDNPGEGCRFVLDLPRHQPKEVSNTSPNSART